MRRKLLALLLTLALALSLLAVPAMAADGTGDMADAAVGSEPAEVPEAGDAESPDGDGAEGDVQPLDDVVVMADATSGTCGDGVYWTLENGVLTISGAGEMDDYERTWSWSEENKSAPWYDQRKNIASVNIEVGVTSIGDYAFYDCTSLTSVTIPDSVTSIGNYAFASCNSLTSVTIPDGVTSIGNYAFASCNSLTSVTISNSVTTIGYWAFSSCSSLISVTIPDSVTNIGSYVFEYCTSLTSVTISDSVTSIGGYAFRNCTSLTSVTIPDSVTSIGNYAFYRCTSLTSAKISNSVTSIGTSTFEWTGLTSVTIPNSVAKIQYCAFHNCDSLTSIVIPDTVQSIEEAAFGDCDSLTSAVIGTGVQELGERAFFNDPKLTSITIGAPSAEIGIAAIGLKGEFLRNPDGIGYYFEYEPVAGATIYGYTGSTAQSYANINTVTFVPLDGDLAPDELVIVPEASETTYVLESGGTITIYCTGELSDFIRLLVDGQEVDPSNYQLAEGSTIVTLISAYLDTLSVGKHTVDLVFTTGTAQTTITILARGSGTSDRPLDSTPQTGDNSMLTLWMTLAVISLVGMAVMVLYSRKIRH